MKRILLLCVLLPVVFSCREPRSMEYFQGGEGPYVFTLQLTDTTAAYHLDFYTRIDGDAQELPADLPLHISWRSPSDSLFQETVYLPLSREIYVPYRSGVRPREWGEWTLRVSPRSLPEGWQGLGLAISKQTWDTEN